MRPERMEGGGAEQRVALWQIVGHIERNLSRRISVDELAQVVGVSALQLSRTFRRDHASTPYALVLQVRVERAKDLLRAGAAIADAAAGAGFADQSHLTRHFRRLAGTTPRKYVTNVARGRYARGV